MFFDDLAVSWDKNYDECVVYRDRNKVLGHWLSRHATQADGRPIEAVDIGCGTGTALECYRRRGILPIGVDISHDMLKKAKAKGYKQAIRFNGVLFPLQPNSIGLAHMFNVIEFVEHPETLLADIHRVLTHNGFFLMNIVNFDNMLEGGIRLVKTIQGRPHAAEHPMLVAKYNYSQMSSLLRAAGFLDVRVFSYGISGRATTNRSSAFHELTRNRFLGGTTYIQSRK